MRVIHKQVLKTTDFQKIVVPLDSKILTVQLQNGLPCIWYEHDFNKVDKYIDVYTFGTGHSMDFEYIEPEYIATYQIGGLVFHVYIEQS